MKEYKGMMLPDGEAHLIEWMEKMGQMRDGKCAYQKHKYDASVEFCKHRRAAVDIGAHVGLLTRLMALDFQQVHAFEPMPEHARCWRVNMAPHKNATLQQVALGSVQKIVRMRTMTDGSSGDTGVSMPGEAGGPTADVQMITLDSLNLEHVDFIKCDNEGYEYFAMLGAEQTILRCRPIIMVEQKEGHGKRYGISDVAARDFLKGLGMRLLTCISGDCIMGWA